MSDRRGLPSFKKSPAWLVEDVNTVAASGATSSLLDANKATIHYVTLSANWTPTFPTARAGQKIWLGLVQGSPGSRTVTWPSNVLWMNRTAPVLSTATGSIDVCLFVCMDGVNWLGFFWPNMGAPIQQPTLDGTSSATSGAFTTALTWTHTVGSGANSILVAAVARGDGSGTQSCTVDDGGGGTHNMIRVGTVAPGGIAVDIWYWLSPLAGARTVQYQTDSGVHMSAVSASYFHVDQSTPFGTTANDSSHFGAMSGATTVTALATDLVLSAIGVYDNTPQTITAGAGQTKRGDVISASQIHTVLTDQSGAGSVGSSFSWPTDSDPLAMLSVPMHGAA